MPTRKQGAVATRRQLNATMDKLVLGAQSFVDEVDTARLAGHITRSTAEDFMRDALTQLIKRVAWQRFGAKEVT